MQTWLAPAVWITLANVLYLASYAVHDILWLRALSVVAALLLLPYYYLQSPPLWAPIYWSLAFVALNTAWIVALVLERRPVRLTPDEQRLRELAFHALTPRETRHLFDKGFWEDFDRGASILEHDRVTRRLSVILHGSADVEQRGVKIGELSEGQFVGEIDSRAEELSDLDVVVTARVRALCWPRATLEDFLRGRPDVELSLTRSIDLQLRRLLDAALAKLRSGSA